jgi:type VI protein secretion system component Hcp
MESNERVEEESLEDLELTDDDARKVTGGDGKRPYLTFNLTNVTISSVNTSPPPKQN